jgi:S1-C subfamily serine protease
MIHEPPGVVLVHLSGDVPVARSTLSRLPATLGSDADADVVLPGTAPRHCLLYHRGHQVVALDSGSGRGTFVDGQSVHEVVLHEGDVLELGAGGPRLRVLREDRRRAEFTGVTSQFRRLSDTAVFRAVTRTSRTFQRTLTVLAVLLAAVALWAWRENARMREQIGSLQRDMKAGEVERRLLEARVEAERQKAHVARREVEDTLQAFHAREEELEGRIAEAATGEAQILREALETTRTRIHQLETERAAGENIIRQYGAGVCLIQGSYGFRDAEGRPLRVRLTESGAPARQGDGGAALGTAGNGPVHSVDYYGTGFLVDGRGLILTNRHVAEPWWNDQAAEALEHAGFTPHRLALRAFFPGQRQPFALTMVRRADKVDLALLQGEDLGGRRIPVLPLAKALAGAVPGQPVVVVGYPAGLEALLAKAETSLVRQILESHGPDTGRVTEALSVQGLIRPSTTQGHIGDVTSTDIVFDAATTQGGSGGPVFNKHGQVIAVEYAVLSRFGGNSFGIPIAYALDLLKGAGTGD